LLARSDFSPCSIVSDECICEDDELSHDGGYRGRPLTAHSLYCRIIVITKRLLGRSINPHLLRDCAATTLSTRSPDDALTAAALLGHRNFRTTERYYIRANQLEASRQVGMLIDRIRTGSKEEP
jgi:integrase